MKGEGWFLRDLRWMYAEASKETAEKNYRENLAAGVAGDFRAQEELAVACFQLKRIEESLRWFDKAAHNGSIDAAMMLMIACEPLGQSVWDVLPVVKCETNVELYRDLSLRHLQSGIDCGSLDAMYRAAFICECGGLYEQALMWSKRIAISPACYNLFTSLASLYNQSAEPEKAHVCLEMQRQIEELAAKLG